MTVVTKTAAKFYSLFLASFKKYTAFSITIV